MIDQGSGLINDFEDVGLNGSDDVLAIVGGDGGGAGGLAEGLAKGVVFEQGNAGFGKSLGVVAEEVVLVVAQLESFGPDAGGDDRFAVGGGFDHFDAGAAAGEDGAADDARSGVQCIEIFDEAGEFDAGGWAVVAADELGLRPGDDQFGGGNGAADLGEDLFDQEVGAVEVGEVVVAAEEEQGGGADEGLGWGNVDRVGDDGDVGEAALGEVLAIEFGADKGGLAGFNGLFFAAPEGGDLEIVELGAEAGGGLADLAHELDVLDVVEIHDDGR